ncbi:MAG TPA: zinc ribbon domain-containing protein [Pyrinomonadaceae bacterium]|jgi:hypothetical protein
MFCPQCGSNQSDELKFCKLCGANLYAVRQVVATRETGEKFDWSKTWLSEMFLSEEERKRRKAKMELRRGITPEVKRYQEIKAGVITSSVGLAVAIVLYVLMPGIILGGNVPPEAVEILKRVWVAGVIPMCVGLALIINGLFVSRKIVELHKRESQTGSNKLEQETEPQALRSADTNEFTPTGFSVTEGTTKHLNSLDRKQ